jgi:hypothetical protein
VLSFVVMIAMLGSARAEAPEMAAPVTRAPAARRGKKGKGKKKPGWKNELFARPVLGGSTYTSTDGETTSALGLGGEGGIRYWEVRKPYPRLQGRTRLHAQYLISSGAAEGMEVKVGSFMGPTWKYIGLSSGLDVFWNRWVWNDVPLEPTVGIGVPAIVTLGVDRVGVYGGVEPAYIFNEDRRVDWSKTDEFGFGHQFTVMTGVHLRIDKIVVGAGYSRTVTVNGVQQGYGLSLNFRA